MTTFRQASLDTDTSGWILEVELLTIYLIDYRVIGDIANIQCNVTNIIEFQRVPLDDILETVHCISNPIQCRLTFT